MGSPGLKVVVQVDPPDMGRESLDRLMDGEITRFEEELKRRQVGQGLRPESLATAERGILKAYLIFARSPS